MAAMSKQAVAKVQAGRDSGTGEVDDDGGDNKNVDKRFLPKKLPIKQA